MKKQFGSTPDLSFLVAKEVFAHKSVQFFASIAGTLLEPSLIFEQLPDWGKRMNSYNIFETQVLERSFMFSSMRIVQRYAQQEQKELNAELSMAGRGSIMGILNLTHCQLLDFRSVKCIQDGDECCIFEFSWLSKNILPRTLGIFLLSGLSFLIYQKFGNAWQLNLLASLAFGIGIDSLVKRIQTRDALFKSYQFQQQTLMDMRRMADDRLELNQKLLSYQGQLSQALAMSSMGEMSFGFAHDMSSPLTLLQVNIENMANLVEENKVNPERLRKFIQNTEKATARITRLLALFRSVIKGAKSDQVGSQNVGQIATELVELYQPFFLHHQIQVTLSVDPATPNVKTYDGALEMILVNLVHNACNVLVSHDKRSIEIKVRGDGRHVIFEVADSGPGIDPVRAQHLWERFGASRGSTGFGLYNIKKTVDKIQGRISVQTGANGTTFSVTAPIQLGEEIKVTA